MIDYENYFSWPGVQMHHFYIYFVFAAIIALYLIIKSHSKYKLELYFISFFLLTGGLNNILTLKIPGFSLFEIHPFRFVYLMLFFFIIRKTLLSRVKLDLSINKNIPWFLVALFSFVLWLIISLTVNVAEVGIGVLLKEMVDALAFLIIMLSLGLMADKPSYDLIGKSIIIGAVLSSFVSLIQLSIDPYFLRIGDDRPAFGNFLRSNGIFTTEYYNSYYLIIAITWTFVTKMKSYLKIALVCLFSLGVLSSFQRMSWIILILVLLTYLVYIKKVAIEKLVLAGLASLAILLSIYIFNYKDITNSSLVKERLSESVDGRKGYYAMVLDNIGKKPLFGYGDLKNEVYYVNMLRITGNRNRATAEEGDLHSGYFSALFLYGVPGVVTFISFVLLSVFYYSKAYKDNLYYVVPFLISILFMIGNLTNTFLFLKYISYLYAIHIGIGIGINQIKKQSDSQNNTI